MRAQIRLILANSNEAEPYIAARGAGTPPPPPGRKLADLRANLNLASDLSSAPATSFVSESPNAEVTATTSRITT